MIYFLPGAKQFKPFSWKNHKLLVFMIILTQIIVHALSKFHQNHYREQQILLGRYSNKDEIVFSHLSVGHKNITQDGL